MNSECLEAADRIGFQLCKDAIWDAEYCNWMGWAPQSLSETMTTYSWQSLGSSMYDGTAGIAWFLTQLACDTGSPIHRRTAIGAIQHALKHHADSGPRNAAGFFFGSLGCAVSAVNTGTKLQNDCLSNAGLNLMLECSRAVDEQEFDVIGGSAGAIPLLIGFGKQLNDARFLEIARGHAERLLSLSIRHRIGDLDAWEVCWKSPSFAHGLTGYSHGVAGFVNAMLEIHQLLGGDEYLNAAREALTYERRRFDKHQQNWLDLRTEDSAPAAAGCAWCHGAAGIGLARLRALELVPQDVEIIEEIKIALDITTKSIRMFKQSGANLSLCHGLLGNIELILAAHEVGIEVKDGLAAADDVVVSAIGQSRTHIPWKCGTQDGRATPGLMLGIAGIGSMLLRYDDPKNTIPLLLSPKLVRNILEPARVP